MEIEGKHYQFYKEDRSEIIYIWQVEDAVLCTLAISSIKFTLYKTLFVAFFIVLITAPKTFNFIFEPFNIFYINNIRKIYNGIMSKDSIKCELEILKYCDRQVESEEAN